MCIHRCAYVCESMIQSGHRQFPLPDCVCTLSDKQHVTLNSWHCLGWLGPILRFLRMLNKVGPAAIGLRAKYQASAYLKCYLNLWVIIRSWRWFKSLESYAKAFSVHLNIQNCLQIYLNPGWLAPLSVSRSDFHPLFCQTAIPYGFTSLRAINRSLAKGSPKACKLKHIHNVWKLFQFPWSTA